MKSIHKLGKLTSRYVSQDDQEKLTKIINNPRFLLGILLPHIKDMTTQEKQLLKDIPSKFTRANVISFHIGFSDTTEKHDDFIVFRCPRRIADIFRTLHCKKEVINFIDSLYKKGNSPDDYPHNAK